MEDEVAAAPPRQEAPASNSDPLGWMSELTKVLDQSIQTAGTWVESNSALLANTLALDKLSEFDGAESLKVIYSEDPAALSAMTELLLLQEQARSVGDLAMNYSHSLADAAQAGGMFGESLRKLALKTDPRSETLWESSWHALSLDQVMQPGAGPSGSGRKQPAEMPLPEGLPTFQALLFTLGSGQAAAHARLLELAASSPGHLLRGAEALREAYRAEVRPINEKYSECKRRWRYSLNQAVAHRALPEEAARFEAEAAMWRRQWEGASPELVAAAKRVKAEHGGKMLKVLAAYVQGQLKAMGKVTAALQREEYKQIELE